jgi:hypothetical protein
MAKTMKTMPSNAGMLTSTRRMMYWVNPTSGSGAASSPHLDA